MFPASRLEVQKNKNCIEDQSESEWGGWGERRDFDIGRLESGSPLTFHLGRSPAISVLQRERRQIIIVQVGTVS